MTRFFDIALCHSSSFGQRSRCRFRFRHNLLFAAAIATGALLSMAQFALAQFISISPSAISGKTILLDEGSSLKYGHDRTYVYTIGGRVSRGKWRIGPNGAICVDFSNGGGRCDYYVEQNGSLYLKNSYGNLFKVKFAS